MSWLSDIFSGSGTIRQAVKEGAVVVDLRTAYEYDQGHIPHSLNIPLDRLQANIDRLRDLGKPVILCCGGGVNCWEGASVLREAGLPRVITGGDWRSLWRKLQS